MSERITDERLAEIEEAAQKLGCSNHGCLVSDKPPGSVGTCAMCSCYRSKSDDELLEIFLLFHEYRQALKAEREHSRPADIFYQYIDCMSDPTPDDPLEKIVGELLTAERFQGLSILME